MDSAGMDHKASMTKRLYVKVYVKVCKALLEEGEEWDGVEARRLVKEAWVEDSRGNPSMSRSLFNDTLFE